MYCAFGNGQTEGSASADRLRSAGDQLEKGRAMAGIDADSALFYYELSADIYRETGDTINYVRVNRLIRELFVEEDRLDEAIENNLSMIQFLKPTESFEHYHHYLELAELYDREGDQNSRYQYALEAKHGLLRIGDTAHVTVAYKELAAVHLDMGAIDSSSFYIDAALRLPLPPRGRKLLQGIYELLGDIKLFQGDTLLAFASYSEALAISLEIRRVVGTAKLQIAMSEILSDWGQVGRAFEKVDSAKNFALQARETEQLALAYRQEAALWDIQNDYQQAYGAYKRYTELEDSLARTNALTFQSQSQRMLFQERRQVENARLALLLERSNSEVEEQRIWIILLVATLFVSFIISIRYVRTLKKSRWAYRQLQESNRKVLAQSRELAKAQDEIIKSEKMAYLGRIFAGIGHELNTPIAAVKSNLQLIEDAQMREVKKYHELAEAMSPDAIRVMIELVVASYQAQQRPISTNKQRQLKKEVKNYFMQRKPEAAQELTDIFDDLKIYDDLHRFDPFFDNESGRGFLELAVFISTRTRSIMTATEALRRADKILFSLKTYSFKNLEDTKTAFDLVRNINTILTLHQNKLKDITIYKQFDDKVVLEGYPDELTQVWTNLLSNAAYANGFKGNLWIRIRQNAEEVRVEFEDSGGGIDPQVKEQIFEPFETTKPEGEGSGLGLSISKKVVEKHEGKITVENTPSGALFRVSLPRMPQ